MIKDSTVKNRREKAVAAQLSTFTIEEAAKVAGVSRSTMHRYKRDEEFLRQYKEMCKEAMTDAIGKLQAGTAQDKLAHEMQRNNNILLWKSQLEGGSVGDYRTLYADNKHDNDFMTLFSVELKKKAKEEGGLP